MYEIAIDVARHRVNVTLAGLLQPDEAVAFDGELRAAAARAKGVGASFDMLVDFTQSSLLSRSISAESQAFAAWCVANGLRKSANITGSALMKMQVDRVAADSRFRMFPSRAEAIAWLDADD